MLDDIEVYLPPYLSTRSKIKLVDGLKAFPDNIDETRLYSRLLEQQEHIFQGDAFRGVEFHDIEKGSQYAPGIVISNTCDIDIDNKRYLSPRVIYAPIMRLSNYEIFLENQVGLSSQSITSHIEAVRKQEKTEILYLPKGRKLDFEGIVFLNRLYNCKVARFHSAELNQTRLFCLSDYGWYLFLYKLSLHFCRIGEKVDRFVGTVI